MKFPVTVAVVRGASVPSICIPFNTWDIILFTIVGSESVEDIPNMLFSIVFPIIPGCPPFSTFIPQTDESTP